MAAQVQVRITSALQPVSEHAQLCNTLVLTESFADYDPLPAL